MTGPASLLRTGPGLRFTKRLPDPQRMRELLSYNEESGQLIRRNSTGGCAAGTVAAYMNIGRLYVSVDNRKLLAHRVAWAIQTGVWPAGEIDHIDGDKLNNRWANLRLVSRFVNAQNITKALSSSKTGLKGVHPRKDKFQVRITSHGKRHHVGTYATAEAAHQAYLDAKRIFHPQWVQP